MAAEAYSADSATWGCAGLKNLGPATFEGARVISRTSLRPIGWGSVTLPR